MTLNKNEKDQDAGLLLYCIKFIGYKVTDSTSMQQSKPGAKARQQAVDHSFRSRNTKVRSAAVPPPNECPTI